MSRPLFGIIILLLLAGGCGDSRNVPVEQNQNPAQMTDSTLQPKPLPSAIFIKASAAQPIDIPTTLAPVEACSLDMVNDEAAQPVTVISEKTKLKLTGWATNPVMGTNPQIVYLEIDGPAKAFVTAIRGLKRPDVAAHFNKPNLAESGWESFADFSSIPSGVYKVKVIQVDGQSGMLCDTKRSISLN